MPELGDVVAVEYRMCSAGGDGKPPEERRTVLLEILPHPHSLMRALLGDRYAPEALEATTVTADDLVLAGRAGGIRVAVTMSLRGRPPRNELHVTATRGSAMADLFHGYCVVETGSATRAAKAMRPLVHGARVFAAASANLARRAARREPAYPGLRPLLAATYAAARGEGPPPVEPDELLGSVALIERVRATGSPPSAETS
jgi:predicted dehydrogenase